MNRTDRRVGPRLFRTGGPGETIVCILLTAVKAGRLTELGVSATRARLCGFPNDKD